MKTFTKTYGSLFETREVTKEERRLGFRKLGEKATVSRLVIEFLLILMDYEV